MTYSGRRGKGRLLWGPMYTSEVSYYGNRSDSRRLNQRSAVWLKKKKRGGSIRGTKKKNSQVNTNPLSASQKHC